MTIKERVSIAMNIKEIISKKKYGQRLNLEEIRYFVNAYVDGSIPDYQAAAFLMAVYFNGMDAEETALLTRMMAESGDMVDLSEIPGVKVDKHSTGGVGDKISLVVMPIMAFLEIPVAKMSGRGLGHTGGTIDKLESIPGFRVEMPPQDFLEQVKKNHIALVGQSGNMTPADKKIYALRDAIECVDSIPLIASSIMSKKIASGADAIVLDVKVGDGAFMKNAEEARKLAEAMVSIGKNLGRQTVAVLTSMDQPLGREVGNANEVSEAVRMLMGEGEPDEMEVAVEIAAHMAYLAGKFGDIESARHRVEEIIRTGAALEKFRFFVQLQGGKADFVDHPESLYEGVPQKAVCSPESGYLSQIHTESVGRAAMSLGAGRTKKDEEIDHLAGIRCLKKIGDYVHAGEAVFLMRGNKGFEEAETMLKDAYILSASRVERVSSVIGVIS